MKVDQEGYQQESHLVIDMRWVSRRRLLLRLMRMLRQLIRQFSTAALALGARSEFVPVSRLPRAILGSSNILNHRPEHAVMGNHRHKQMRKTSSG